MSGPLAFPDITLFTSFPVFRITRAVVVMSSEWAMHGPPPKAEGISMPRLGARLCAFKNFELQPYRVTFKQEDLQA